MQISSRINNQIVRKSLIGLKSFFSAIKNIKICTEVFVNMQNGFWRNLNPLSTAQVTVLKAFSRILQNTRSADLKFRVSAAI